MAGGAEYVDGGGAEYVEGGAEYVDGAAQDCEDAGVLRTAAIEVEGAGVLGVFASSTVSSTSMS